MYDSGSDDAVAELNAAVRPHLYVLDGGQSMVQGGAWAGEAVPTQVIPAGGDPIATDLMALGLIKAFGRWNLVTTTSVWKQVEIRRAIALGLGAHGPHEVERLTEELSGGHSDFANLIADIRPHADLIRSTLGHAEVSATLSGRIFSLTTPAGQITIRIPPKGRP